MDDDDKAWYLYHLPPIDYWFGWINLSAFNMDDDPNMDNELTGAIGVCNISESHLALIMAIAEEFKKIGWEGDGNFMIAGLPQVDIAESKFMIAVKQYNNGSVFLASEIRLPWLDYHEEKILKGKKWNQLKYDTYATGYFASERKPKEKK